MTAGRAGPNRKGLAARPLYCGVSLEQSISPPDKENSTVVQRVSATSDGGVRQAYLDAYRDATPGGPEWLGDVRERAVRLFEKNGLPGKRDEMWRYTNLRPAVAKPFAQAKGSIDDARALASEYGWADQAAAELVLIDGKLCHELSDLDGLPDTVAALGILEAAEDEALLDEVQQHIAQHAKSENNPFVALNTAFLDGGVYIKVKRGAALEKPIHILSINTGKSESGEPAACFPRVLVCASDGVRFSLVETYCGPNDVPYLTCGVTEIVAEHNCHIDHNKLNAEGSQGVHIATMEVEIGAQSVFVDHNSTIGSLLTRNDLNCHLAGERADATLSGVSILRGKQHVDNHTLLDHQEPNCPSFELYKHVLDDDATGIFKGQIFVHQKAQKTDAKQSSRTLLLSDTAQMQSQPALEIYADDVKCTHGSTTGPLDEGSIFYLNSRGVSSDTARRLLTYAFAADVTRRIKVDPVRERVENFMAKQHGLPTDFRIQDLADATEDVVF